MYISDQEKRTKNGDNYRTSGILFELVSSKEGHRSLTEAKDVTSCPEQTKTDKGYTDHRKIQEPPL